MKVSGHKQGQPIFYVYEHWRPDTNECFWVGKGHERRAFRLSKRNMRHRHVVGYLRKHGLEPEIRIVFDGMTEQEALGLEVAWIEFWRLQGAPLCNFTNGGEGVCGLVHSEQTRAKLRALMTGTKRAPCPPEVRAKISAAQKGRKKGPNPEHSARLRGRKLTPEHRAKIGARHVGRIDPPDVCARRAASNRGRKASEVTRLLLSLSHKGKRTSEETRARQAASMRAVWAKRKEG